MLRLFIVHVLASMHLLRCAAMLLLLLLVAERARLQRFGLLASLPAVRLDTHSASRSQPQGADSKTEE